MQALVFVHLLGLAIFLGGTMSALILNRAASASSDPKALDEAHVSVGRAADGGLLLSLLSGAGLIVEEGVGLFHQPWLHIMLTAFVVCGATGGIATARIRKLGGAPGADKRGAASVLRLVALAAGILAVAAGTFKWGA